MNKDCFILDVNKRGSIAIYVSIDALIDYHKMILKKPDKRKKLNYVIEGLYVNNVNKANYEEYKDYPNTATFKLGRGQDNIRIYCKVEKTTNKNGDPQKRIIFHKIWNKKVQQLSNKEIGFLTAIQKIECNYGRFIG